MSSLGAKGMYSIELFGKKLFFSFSHGECPNEEQTKNFIEVCSNFLYQHPNKHIAVHCTHGFNRTGFLICSYLVTQESWEISAAVKIFAKSRPPGIYKQDYLDKLLEKFGEEDDPKISAPALPAWSNEDNEYEDDEAHVNPQASISSLSHQNASNANASSGTSDIDFIDKISQVFDPEIVKVVQSECSQLCRTHLRGFPGSQPVSLSHRNIELLQNEEYMVSWKADGTRYMMLIRNENETYLFDRDFRVYQLFDVKFLRKNLKESLANTLLDGELVVDVVDNVKWPRFLIYDIVCIDGNDVSDNNFRERLNIIYKCIIVPRETAKKQLIIDRTKEPIGIRIKDFCELRDTCKYFSSKFQNVLSHEIDGLIFQPVNLGYKPGRCDKVLKWKPPSHNSVDFRLRIVKENKPGMLEENIGQLWVGGSDRPFARMKVTRELRQYDNKIIECRYDFERRTWELMRQRTDKSHPNALTTAENVCETMRNPITREVLLNVISRACRQR